MKRMSRRLTQSEWAAIDKALAQALAGPLDGDFTEEEEARISRDMESAQKKVWERMR